MTKDFLSLFDMGDEFLEEWFILADELRLSTHFRPLEGVGAALIFQKPSLRTRLSFELGIRQLGGHPMELPNESIGLGTRESVADVARLLSRYVGVIIARVFEHQTLNELAYHASVPVVNALSDLSHPCQVLSDMYTLREHGRLRPGMKVAFIGDGNNVANSWIEMAGLYPLRLTLATPDGFGPDPDVVDIARSVDLGEVELTDDPYEAVRDADVIYTDVWTSMGQEQERQRRLDAFAGYAVTSQLLSAAPSNCLVMHCLPAHRGEEISAEVIDGPRSIVFDQAENRLHMQKALLVRLLDRHRQSEAVRGRREVLIPH